MATRTVPPYERSWTRAARRPEGSSNIERKRTTDGCRGGPLKPESHRLLEGAEGPEVEAAAVEADLDRENLDLVEGVDGSDEVGHLLAGGQ